ncbi:hypothetical protein AB833_26670 [Chromatiales bacterium (ex Bugula neritina AB1)]|nr:hypothetical protein AB833_26670 [Chromatiales bacterium (ex Bugula neritina AB1)]
MMLTHANRNLCVIVGTALLLAACASNPVEPELASTSQLEPLPRTLLQLNDTQNFIDEVTGDKVIWTVSAVDGDSITMIDQKNCSWTSPGDVMQPSDTWENCGSSEWATGGIDGAKIKGDIWPMQVGNKITYSQYFYNSGGDRSGQRHSRKCAVKSMVSVAVGEQMMDAYRLDCTQDYGDKLNRVYWFAPEVGLVKRRTGSSAKPTEELVRVL